MEIVSVDFVDPRDTGRSGTASTTGLAGVGEFALGGSPQPGFVIGGGIYSAAFTSTPEYTVDYDFGGDTGASSGARTSVETSALALLGPFADIYPSQNAGFHLQAALGYAFLGFEDPDEPELIPLSGFGAMVGLGIEGRVGKVWGIGGLARLLMAWPSGADPSDAQEEYDAAIFAPGLLFTATCY